MLAYLVHLGYILTLFAFLTRDVLILRSLFVSAQIIVGSYALTIGVWTIAVWNSIFLCINVAWIIKILRDRRAVELPEEIRPLYERHFSVLTRQEFLRWWRLGREESIRNGRLMSEHQTPASLYFLKKGTVRVHRGALAVTELPSGFFIGEMSLITGGPATADVDAAGEIEVVRWPTADLNGLRADDPGLWTKIQSAIGHDLVEKIRRGDERVGRAC